MQNAQGNSLIGVDLGKARVGLAVAVDPPGIAIPLSTISYKPAESFARRLDEEISARQPYELVIGMPLDQGGNEGTMAEWVRDIAGRLASELSCKVHFIDERFSSASAYSIARELGTKRKKAKQNIDAAAAAGILQAFLDQRRGEKNLNW